MAYAKTSLRAEKRALREKIRAMGADYRQISAEFARRYKLRPRAAWREAYGWSLKEAAERINSHNGQVGLDPGGIASMTAAHLCEYENWPGFGPKPSGRRPTPYLLALLAALYNCQVTDLLDLDDREHLPSADLLILDKYSQATTTVTEPRAGQAVNPGPSAVVRSGADRRMAGPGSQLALPGAVAGDVPGAPDNWAATGGLPTSGEGGGSWTDLGDPVLAAAGESADRAAADASRQVPQASVDHVLAEVRGMARRYSSVPPLEFLAESRRARDRAYQLARRTRRPRQIADLQVATGAACGLMSVASFDLASWGAAIEQAHAALVYADLADHRGLQAWAAGFQGLIAYWCGRPQDAVRVIGGSLDLAPAGTARARLHCIAARAWAHLGNPDQARKALATADDERDRIGASGADELHDEIGGEFGWGPARQAMCSATALLLIGDADAAAQRATEAIRLYETDRTGSLVDMTARVDLAHAEISRGQLDAAQDALRPVWLLSPPHRRYSLVGRLDAVARALAGSQYVNARIAGDLAAQISCFAAQSAPRAIPAGTTLLEPHVE